jgi:hypothetical protein
VATDGRLKYNGRQNKTVGEIGHRKHNSGCGLSSADIIY